MKEKILLQLKNKYANLGLSNEILEGIAIQLAGFVKEDSDIESAVNGVEATLKATQSFGDKRATAEAERVKKELEGKKDPPPTPKTEDMPAWAKAIVDSNNELKTKLEGFSAEKTSQTLSQKLSAILSEKKIPDSFSKGYLHDRTFKDETGVLAYADLIASEFENAKQDKTNLWFSYTEPPVPGQQPKKDSDEIANMINIGTKEIVESQKQN